MSLISAIPIPIQAKLLSDLRLQFRCRNAFWQALIDTHKITSEKHEDFPVFEMTDNLPYSERSFESYVAMEDDEPILPRGQRHLIHGSYFTHQSVERYNHIKLGNSIQKVPKISRSMNKTYSQLFIEYNRGEYAEKGFGKYRYGYFAGGSPDNPCKSVGYKSELDDALRHAEISQLDSISHMINKSKDIELFDKFMKIRDLIVQEMFCTSDEVKALTEYHMFFL